MRIVSIKKKNEPTEMFDISVGLAEHYILSNGVISHNSGGGGLRYSADYILFLSKKKDKGDGKEVIGNILKVRLIKSRLSRENKEVELRLSYDTGIDKFWGLLEIAERHGIVKKVGNRYEFPDGTKAFAKDIDRNPEKYYTPEILETINNAVHIEYSYGDQREKSLDGDDTETND